MRLVVKTGSAILSKNGGGLDRAAIERIGRQLIAAHKSGHEVVLVSSGAIAAGSARLGWAQRPTELAMKQAAAAVGQLALMEAYEEILSSGNVTPAQVLLTREDLANHERYLNARKTLLHLLALKTIPIINENDAVSTDEIRFGDNDSLSAIVAVKIDADRLILLSDVRGLYEQDENGGLTERVVPVVKRITPKLEKAANRKKGSEMSVGGIVTKLAAAKKATAAGIETWLASGWDPRAVEKILIGEPGAGTRFLARPRGK